ncbi:MAG: hypothetical protein AB4062_02080 [Crocosphaera sp.]
MSKPNQSSQPSQNYLKTIASVILTLIFIPVVVGVLRDYLAEPLIKIYYEYNSCHTTVDEKLILGTDKREKLNVRVGPGTQYNLVSEKSLEHLTPIKVVQYKNGWIEISEPVNGWVAENRTKASLDCSMLIELMQK